MNRWFLAALLATTSLFGDLKEQLQPQYIEVIRSNIKAAHVENNPKWVAYRTWLRAQATSPKEATAETKKAAGSPLTTGELEVILAKLHDDTPSQISSFVDSLPAQISGDPTTTYRKWYYGIEAFTSQRGSPEGVNASGNLNALRQLLGGA